MQAALGHPFVIALPFAVGLLFWLIAIRERRIGRMQGQSFFQRNGTAVGLFLIVAVAFWAVFMIVLPQLFMAVDAVLFKASFNAFALAAVMLVGYAGWLIVQSKRQ